MDREEVLRVKEAFNLMNLHDNYEEMLNNAARAIYAYTVHNPGIKSLVVGMSGGIDSAVTAWIMHEAAPRAGVYTRGYCLPIISNHPDETKRGMDVGKAFLRQCDLVDLSEDFVHLVKALDKELYDAMWYSTTLKGDEGKQVKIRLGNMKARLRMMYLYDRAKKYDGIVMSTDNLTEYLLGFWTLHGDVGDFGPIQNLYKTEVYGIANWLINDSDRHTVPKTLRPTMDAMPTDGLGIGNGDLAQLLPDWKGTYIEGYREIDKELIRYQKDSPRSNRRLGTVAHRHIQTKFKRENPYSPSREELLEEWS